MRRSLIFPAAVLAVGAGCGHDRAATADVMPGYAVFSDDLPPAEGELAGTSGVVRRKEGRRLWVEPSPTGGPPKDEVVLSLKDDPVILVNGEVQQGGAGVQEGDPVRVFYRVEDGPDEIVKLEVLRGDAAEAVEAEIEK